MLHAPNGLDLRLLDNKFGYLLLHAEAESSNLLIEAMPKSDQIVRFTEVNASGTSVLCFRGLALMRVGSVSHENKLDQVFALEQAGFETWNSSLSYLLARDRIYAIQWLQKQKIPLPRFVVPTFGHSLNEDTFKELGKQFIVKVARGTKGYGVMKCSSFDELRAVVETFLVRDEHVVVQEYLENYEEVRVLILQDHVLGCYRKHDSQGFRNNLHQRAQVSAFEPSCELKRIALDAHRASKLNYSGVDLMMRGDDIRVLEVNASPGLVGFAKTDLDVIEKFAAMLWQRFLEL